MERYAAEEPYDVGRLSAEDWEMSSENEDLVLPKESTPTKDEGTTVDMTMIQFRESITDSVQIHNCGNLYSLTQVWWE